jgi:hypothetical protein
VKAGRTLTILGVGFTVMGLIPVTIAAYFFVQGQKFRSGALTADGEVIDPRGAPTVQFVLNGKPVSFDARVSSDPPAYKPGEHVRVLYHPENPAGAQIDSFVEQWLAVTIPGGIGGLFTTVGGIMLLIQIRGAQRRARALSRGAPVDAVIASMDRAMSVRINGRHPWVIVARYEDKDTDKTLTFESEYLMSDPNDVYELGGTVRVYYVPYEPGTYAFQLEGLPDA